MTASAWRDGMFIITQIDACGRPVSRTAWRSTGEETLEEYIQRKLEASASDQPALNCDETIAVKQLVKDFNESELVSTFGAGQPPLTVAEVIAVLSGAPYNSRFNISSEDAEILNEVVISGELPIGSEFDFTTEWRPGSNIIRVWWVDLSIPGRNGTEVRVRVRERSLELVAILH